MKLVYDQVANLDPWESAEINSRISQPSPSQRFSQPAAPANSWTVFPESSPGPVKNAWGLPSAPSAPPTTTRPAPSKPFTYSNNNGFLNGFNRFILFYLFIFIYLLVICLSEIDCFFIFLLYFLH